MDLFKLVSNFRKRLAELATIALMGIMFANDSSFVGLDDGDPQSFYTRQLAYERARGMLDAIQEVGFVFIGETETNAMLRECAKAIGFDKHDANTWSIHADAHLAKHAPSRPDFSAQKPSQGNYVHQHPQGSSGKGQVGEGTPLAKPATAGSEQSSLPFAEASGGLSPELLALVEGCTQKVHPDGTIEYLDDMGNPVLVVKTSNITDDDWDMYETMGCTSHALSIVNASRHELGLPSVTHAEMHDFLWDYDPAVYVRTFQDDPSVITQAGVMSLMDRIEAFTDKWGTVTFNQAYNEWMDFHLGEAARQFQEDEIPF